MKKFSPLSLVKLSVNQDISEIKADPKDELKFESNVAIEERSEPVQINENPEKRSPEKKDSSEEITHDNVTEPSEKLSPLNPTLNKEEEESNLHKEEEESKENFSPENKEDDDEENTKETHKEETNESHNEEENKT